MGRGTRQIPGERSGIEVRQRCCSVDERTAPCIEQGRDNAGIHPGGYGRGENNDDGNVGVLHRRAEFGANVVRRADR